ncbi:MAG: hypothetical protein QOJ81_1179 [Chloroflexota bacterium]|nr:hypothetical protein [Chloroflexota bacterium]
MPGARDLIAQVPDPWRRWLTVRRARRWLRAVLFERRHNRGLAAHAPRASFFPMRLEPTAAVAHALARIGVRITGFGARADLVIAWETGTWLPPGAVRRLPESAINGRCTDISKTTVDRVWTQIAGYSISVDPLTWDGPLVVKPDVNGVRGGRIVAGPLASRRPHWVYQRLIDCVVNGRVRTLRPMIFEGRILAVYDKWRAGDDRFSGPEEVLVRTADDVLSPAEQGQLLQFANGLGMDYGELDVLRDEGSGLIYVVDANRTPIRPRGLKRQDDDAAFGALAQALTERIGRGGP